MAHAQEEGGEGGEEQGPGGWVLTKVQGTFESTSKSKSTGGSFAGSPQTETFESTYSTDGSMGVFKRVSAIIPNGSSPGGEAVASSKATSFKVWLLWQGGGIPTKTCYLRILSSASSNAGAHPQANASWSFSVSNGAGSSKTDTSNSPNCIREENYMRQDLSADGPYKIVSVDTNSQHSVQGKTISVLPSSEGTISATSYHPNYGSGVSAGVGVGALPLDYSLSIGRGVGAKIKGAPGVVIDEDKDEWIDEDGVGHGHTTYSYNYASKIVPAITRSYYNWQSFGPSLGSNWSEGALGTWSPSSDGDTKTQHEKDMIFGTPKLVQVQSSEFDSGLIDVWEGSPTGKGQANVSYTIHEIVDGTSITETAQYKLTLHDEWEEISTVTDPNLVLKNPQQIGGGSTNGTSAPATFNLAVTETKKIAIKGGFSTELGKKVADLLKVVPKFSLDVTYEDTTATTNTFPATLQPGETTWLEVWETYKRHHVKGMDFSPNGYVGTSEFDADEPTPPHYTYKTHYPPIPGMVIPGGEIGQ